MTRIRWQVLKTLSVVLVIAFFVGSCSRTGIAENVYRGLPEGSGDPVDEGPLVYWAETDETITVTTWGSSSCPAIADSIDVIDEQTVRILFVSGSSGSCTADMAATTRVIRMPDDVESPLLVELEFEDFDEISSFLLE